MMVTGMIGSGKTTYAKHLAEDILAFGYPVIVHDPNNDGGWPDGAFVTSDWEDFKFAVWSSVGALVILDEIKLLSKDKKKLLDLVEILRLIRGVGRKEGFAGGGHNVMLIGQRYLDAPPDIRSQCNKSIAFAQQTKGGIAIIEEMNDREKLCLGVADLLPHHYIEINMIGKGRLGVNDFERFT